MKDDRIKEYKQKNQVPRIARNNEITKAQVNILLFLILTIIMITFFYLIDEENKVEKKDVVFIGNIKEY